MWGNIVDWGSVPAWAAFTAAAIAAYFTGRNLNNASAQLAIANDTRDRELERDKREQAANVATWVDLEANGRLAVKGWNRSGLPVYWVQISVTLDIQDRLAEHISLAVLPPSPDAELISIVFEQGDHWPVPPAEVLADMYRDGLCAVEVSFLDSASVCWKRDSQGALVEIPPS